MSSVNERLLKACRREEVDCTPVWIMRQAGRYLPEYRKIRKKYDVLSICRNPEIAAEVTMLPVEKLGLDAAIIFADIMLPLETIGVKFEIKDKVGPIVHKPVRKREDVESLVEAKVKEDVPFVFETIRILRRYLKVPLIGFSGAPFTLASYMVEGGASRVFERTKNLMRQESDIWHSLMGKLSDLVVDYLKEQVSAGVQVVQLFDSWVGCLSLQEYRKFVMPYSKRIFEELRGLGIPAIHFGTNTAHLLEALKEAGGDVIGVDWRISLDEAWRRIGYNVGIQGNLDPSVLLGPTGHVKKKVIEVLIGAGNRPGHIFNLGHGILPETPVENVVELVNTVHEHSNRLNNG